MLMNKNIGELKAKPIEDVAKLESAPERIEEVIKHITEAIGKLKKGNELNKEELIRSLEKAREEAQKLLSEYLEPPESEKSLKETIH